MTDLVALVSTGKGTWTEVLNLIKAEEWENIYIVTNLFGAQKFRAEKKVNFIIIDNMQDMKTISNTIYEELKDKLKLEVGLNFYSGTGKEHMALLSAIIKTGAGIRLVATKDNEMIEI